MGQKQKASKKRVLVVVEFKYDELGLLNSELETFAETFQGYSVESFTDSSTLQRTVMFTFPSQLDAGAFKHCLSSYQKEWTTVQIGEDVAA